MAAVARDCSRCAIEIFRRLIFGDGLGFERVQGIVVENFPPLAFVEGVFRRAFTPSLLDVPVLRNGGVGLFVVGADGAAARTNATNSAAAAPSFSGDDATLLFVPRGDLKCIRIKVFFRWARGRRDCFRSALRTYRSRWGCRRCCLANRLVRVRGRPVPAPAASTV